MSETLPQSLKDQITQLIESDRPRLRRLWLYYRNPLTPISTDSDDSGCTRPYRQAQEWGLPPRLTGQRASAYSESADPLDDVERKEIVIENDIAWRIDAQIDALFGKAIVLNSTATNELRRTFIENLLRQILANHGGVVFLQQLALTGFVYGFADVLVKFDPTALNSLTTQASHCGTHDLGQPMPKCDPSADDPKSAPAAVPLAHDSKIDPAASNPLANDAALLQRLAALIRFELVEPTRALPVLSPIDYRTVEAYAQVYEIDSIVPKKATWMEKFWSRSANNFRPVKSESRVVDLPIAPGRMWMTDNENASITEFGGDADCPNETAHINEIREALDKTSSVTPIAAGAIRGRIGNLTSAAALKITLMALISRTEKKRLAYGAGIARMCELALAWLDRAGLFKSLPEERRIQINWPDPLPQNDAEQLQLAQTKLALGVSKEIILRELGYQP